MRTDMATTHHNANIKAIWGHSTIQELPNPTAAIAVESCRAALDVAGQCVLGIRLNVVLELLSHTLSAIGIRIPFKTTHEAICLAIENEGYRVIDQLAGLPSLHNARFCFPLYDHQSHRLLLSEILAPRIYSLSRTQRCIFRTYKFMVEHHNKPSALCPFVFLLISKR
jgi:hypothetical protein